MFKRGRGFGSAPATPKIPKIPLPGMGGGDDHSRSKLVASPVKHVSPIESHTHITTQGETSAAGRAASKRREEHAPACGETSTTQKGSSRPRGETSMTGGRSSKAKPTIVNVRLVPMKTPEVNLHWQLLPHEPRHSKPRLHFDAAYPIHFIRFVTYPRPLTAAELDKPVADEPLSEMVIHCERFPDWPVWVRRADGLRCRDVFEAIFETYNKVLTPAERKGIPAIHIKACERAFRNRCEASGALPAWEQAQGLRRVDLLRGETIFKGLTRPKPTGDWVLNLGSV